MIFGTGWKREARGGVGGSALKPFAVVPTSSPMGALPSLIFAKASPAEQQQILARPLPDGPRWVIDLGGDSAAKLSFPLAGGAITLPLVGATRAFYETAGWQKTAEKLRERNGFLSTAVFEGSREFDRSSLYGSVQTRWSSLWFRADDGIPVYKFEREGAPNAEGRRHVERWVVAIEPEDPRKTGRQAFKFILREHREGFLARLWDILTNIPAVLVDGIKAFIDALKGLACGPARPFLDDLAILAAAGPGGLGATKLSALAKASGKSEAELAKAATDPKSAVIEQLTNAIVTRICGASAFETAPVPAATTTAFPAGSVAVFDAGVGQYRILAPPL